MMESSELEDAQHPRLEATLGCVSRKGPHEQGLGGPGSTPHSTTPLHFSWVFFTRFHLNEGFMLEFRLIRKLQDGEPGAREGCGLPRSFCARTGAGGQVSHLQGTLPGPASTLPLPGAAGGATQSLICSLPFQHFKHWKQATVKLNNLGRLSLVLSLAGERGRVVWRVAGVQRLRGRL